MPQFKYTEIAGVPVIEVQFNDSKAEQEWRKRVHLKMQEGFMLVGQWLPGIQNNDRADPNRCISRLRLFTAPIVDGKPVGDVSDDAAVTGVAAPVSLEIPPELKAMSRQEMLALAPRVGAITKITMSNEAIVAAMAIGIKQHPKEWGVYVAAVGRRADEMKRMQEAGKRTTATPGPAAPQPAITT